MHCLFRLYPAGDIRLVRHHDQREACRTKPRERLRHARQQLDLIDARRREGLVVPYQRAIDDAVAIEKHRGPHRVDSHFVAATLRSGWDTSRCQITAWNASA